MIYRDKDKRLRRKAVGIVAALIAAGLLTWMYEAGEPEQPAHQGLKDQYAATAHLAQTPAPRVVEQPAAVQIGKGAVPAAPVPQDQPSRFAALTAPGATPAMLSEAWELALNCEREGIALRRGVQTSELSEQKCRLPPGGKWQDAATVKRMLEARVARSDYGAREDVASHRLDFADDPQRWRQLMAEAYTQGLANAEPVVTGTESATVFEQANALHALGRLEEARDAYRKAAVFAVASAVNNAREVATKAAALGVAPPPMPIATDSHVAAVWPKLSEAERREVTTAGKALAKNWKRTS